MVCSFYRLKNERDEANDRAEKLRQTLSDCQEQLAAAEAERDELHRKVPLWAIYYNKTYMAQLYNKIYIALVQYRAV